MIIDSITEINEVIKIEIEKRTGRAIQKNDWVEVQNKIKGVVRGFRDLDMHCLFLALENTERDEERVVAITPSLNGKSATDIAAFMDIVGYIYIDKATGERKVRVAPHNLYLTKDRSNVLPEEPEVDFSAWVEAVKGIKAEGSQKVTDYAAPKAATPDIDASKELPPAPAGKTPPPLKKEEPKKEEAGLTADTRNEFFACWKNLWSLYIKKHTLDEDENGLLKFAPHTEEGTRRNTLETLYKVDSSTRLTETQAKDFIQRMRNKIKALEALPDTILPEGTDLAAIYAADIENRGPKEEQAPATPEAQAETPTTEAPAEEEKKPAKKATK